MKIAIAQFKPVKGSIAQNIVEHLRLVNLAVAQGTTAIFFSELSITAYEPALAKALSTTIDDERFKPFQKISDQHGITIGIGLPLVTENKPQIAMLVFQPNQARVSYAKQILHEDEYPFFQAGQQSLILKNNQVKIAPAICYESLQLQHIEQAISLGANVYVASVAKSQKGVDKAEACFSKRAKQYAIPVLMSNSVGYCDNFESAGQSTVWNKNGELLAQLEKEEEGLLIYDSIQQTVEIIKHGSSEKSSFPIH